jgi:hypothetical protein
MDTADILHTRMHAQLIEGSSAATPHQVVSHLLAMQAQDYAGATWAIGLRLPGSTLADVERALVERTIIRTWPMRGTLHFVTAEDVRWLLALLAPRVLERAARREAQLGLSTATFAQARKLFIEALVGGRRLARPDAMSMLETSGIATAAGRGYHVLWRLAQEGLLVMGPMEGGQQTFALLDEWLPPTSPQAAALASREEALAKLAARYFAGHGPATVADLARWAQIPKREAANAVDAVVGTLESSMGNGERYWFAPQTAKTTASATGRSDGPRAARRVHPLPGFDEYMLGYAGREHQLGRHLDAYGSRVASNGMLAPTIVVDGRVVGIWKRTLNARAVRFTTTEFEPLGATAQAALLAEQERYARFVGRKRNAG